jgi:hypothetical protein
LHEESRCFLTFPTTCNGLGFRVKPDFAQTLIFSQNGLSGIAQKDRRNQRTRGGNAKGQNEMVDGGQGCPTEPRFYVWHENIHSSNYLPVFCFHISNDKIQFFL